jgi:mRNA interferase MazF
MVIRRGEIWWADLGDPRGSEPGFVRPVVVVQADELNTSRLRTVVCAILTSNLDRAAAAGNVRCSARATGLPKESVIQVSQLVALDRNELRDHVGTLSPKLQLALDAGLRVALEL